MLMVSINVFQSVTVITVMHAKSEPIKEENWKMRNSLLKSFIESLRKSLRSS